jgi:hypothetical protein
MFQEFTPPCGRTRARRLSGYFAVLAALLLTIVAPCARAQAACNVVYTISPQNSSAFGAAITIKNTGTTAWTSWTLTWTFANGQTVSSGNFWNGIESQSGANVTVKNESYNGSIAAGGSLTGLGFNGTWNGTTNAVPTTFAVNGTTCGTTGGFTLKPSAATLSVAQGASGTDTITVTDVSPFNGSVTFTASGMPSGVTASFSPASSVSSSVLSLTASATATVGPASVTITGTSGTFSATTTIALTITAKPTFTLMAPTLSITQGKTATDTITITDVGGFTGNVTLAVSNLPAGVTCTFGTNPATTTSVMTCTASATATVGNSTATITGTSGSTVVTTTFPVTVIPSTGSFSLTPSGNTCTMPQGGSCTVTINITDVSPFNGSVTFTASGLPSGVTASFSPASSASLSVLTLYASSTATVGTYTVTITGTSGGLTAITTITLTITSPNPGTCSVNYMISPQSSTAFGAALTIQNTGSTAWTSWKLTWTFANGQTVSSFWNGIESQSGANVTVTNESYNGAVAAGGNLTGLGFNGTWNGVTNAVPTAFSINGAACAVAAPPSFTLAPSAGTLSLTQGSTSTDTISVTDVSGFTGSVTFTASGLPSGVTASFSPASSTSTSLLTLTATSTATIGAATVTITGTSGTTTASTTIALTVKSATGFTLTPSTSSVVLAVGSTATDSITITDTGGFSGSVTLAATGLPTGVTAAFAPNPATATSVLTLTSSSSAVAGTYIVTVIGTSGTTTNSIPITLTVTSTTVTPYTQHFLDLYNDYHNSANGYFSPLGVPYHSVETLMVEAPDYGHETVSETYSYYIWLETMYGNITGNWAPLQTAWTSLETYMIPSATLQPNNAGYNASSPATYAPEFDSPSSYPATQTSSVPVGADPLFSQLSATYGNDTIYGMHWIIDSDNWYGYGQEEDGVTKPSCINTYQRGPMESVWLTIPQPCWDNFTYGGPNGYLDLFAAPGPYTKQYKYTDAPDADARAIQAIYWAQQYAAAQGGSSIVTGLLPKAAKMGDFLRYSFFDKYFKVEGCQSTSCAGGSGYNSSAYLLAWYYAWGGAAPSSGQTWAWRIGASGNHFGYQNPVAAYALSNDTALVPLSAQAKADWTTSLERQIEFYRWLQSSNGAIAGGATNSWDGDYSVPPAGTSTFYGMSYTYEPVYHNPPSNQWFGMQVWSMERVAEYYYITGDAHAKIILDPWIAWVEANTTTNSNGTYTIPGNLSWTGQPALNWNATTQNWTAGTAFNSGLTVTITSTSVDIGETGALCKALSYYSAGTAKWAATQDLPSQILANTLLQDVWTNYRDSIGISAPETRTDYTNFLEAVYVPANWGPGTMPNGDPINTSSTFLSLRTKYESDPNYSKVSAYLAGGAAPVFNYHRFWAQVDIATAYAVYAHLFPGN